MNNRRERRAQESLKRKIERRVARETPLMEFQVNAPTLQGVGPIIETYISVTDVQAQLLRDQGQPVPDRIRCRLLIDTGAGRTTIKHEIAERAGLKLINANKPIHGIGIDTTGRVYMGRVLFICVSRVASEVTHNISVDAQIASGNLDKVGHILDGLIGRDVLRHFDFRYDGGAGKFTLKYLGPSRPLEGFEATPR